MGMSVCRVYSQQGFSMLFLRQSEYDHGLLPDGDSGLQHRYLLLQLLFQRYPVTLWLNRRQPYHRLQRQLAHHNSLPLARYNQFLGASIH